MAETLMQRRSSPFVLLVSNTPALTPVLKHAIQRSGFEPVVVRGFQDAKLRLSGPPALVVTELKLEAYNGLHLAMYAAEVDAQTIVVAEAAYRGEIEQLGAYWLSPDAASVDLPALIARAVAVAAPPVPGFPWYAVDPRMNTLPATVWRTEGSLTEH